MVWTLFFIGSITFNIIIANMMIAVAGNTYDRVSSGDREILTLRKKVYFLADYVFDWLGGRLAGGSPKYRYMYMIEPQVDIGILD